MASLYYLATLCCPARSTAELKHQITVREAAQVIGVLRMKGTTTLLVALGQKHYTI